METRQVDWYEAVEIITRHVVRISTPEGSGTGFFIGKALSVPIIGIATAAHVVRHAHDWQQPIKIEHFDSGKSLILPPGNRAVLIDAKKDTAVIAYRNDGPVLPLPEKPIPLIPEKNSAKVGVEVGWMGFPAISRTNLCFFSGYISTKLRSDNAYLVDGVAINGVSGGPTFCSLEKTVVIIGVVSAYIANRATGEVLPGLSLVSDVSQFPGILQRFKSFDEAKAKEQEAAESHINGEDEDVVP